VARQPGTASPLSLLFTLIKVGFGLTILIGGHLIVLYQFWFWLQAKSGIELIAKDTGLPVWSLGLCVLAALTLDIWIAYSSRKQKQAAYKR